MGVVAVVGGQQRRLQLSGDLDELRVGALLLGDAVSRLINGPPERRLMTLRAALTQMERELTDLRAEIAKLESVTSRQSDASTAPLPVGKPASPDNPPSEQAA